MVPSLSHSWAEDDRTGFAETSMVEIQTKNTTTKTVEEAIIKRNQSKFKLKLIRKNDMIQDMNAIYTSSIRTSG